MNYIRAMFCVLLVFSLLTCVGCKGNASKIAKALKQQVRNEAMENALERGINSITNSSTNSSSSKKTPASSNSVKSNSGKIAAVTGAGVAAATGAMANPSPKNEAAKVLVGYYKAIADRKMAEAYNTLSYEMQNQLGTYESFSSSYGTTVSNDVSNISVVYEALNEIRFAYRLTSKDNINGRMSVQVFSGEATLSKIDGRWLITDFMVRLAK